MGKYLSEYINLSKLIQTKQDQDPLDQSKAYKAEISWRTSS